MESIITFVTLVAGFMMVFGGIVTIVWFIKDSRKENSKVLKDIEKGQREGFQTLSNDLKILSEGQQTMAKILERIEANTR